MSRFSPITRINLSLPLAVGSLLTLGCAETPTLFEEHGIWLATHYTLQAGDTPYMVSLPEREFGYQLAFNSNQGVVAAAACQDGEGSTSINTSLCHFDQGSTWDCRCFYYQFEESTMQWSEFPGGAQAASTPPPADGDGGGQPGVYTINVSAADTASSYVFSPFPTGLFGALEGAAFTFQQKGTTIWDNPPPPPKYPMEAPGAHCGVCFN